MKKDHFSHWVYKITGVDEEENEICRYSFKPEFDHRDIFKITNEPLQYFDLNRVIMILPEPLQSRGRYIFPGHIDLKNNIKMCL